MTNLTDISNAIEKQLAQEIWAASHLDEGTISATGADNIARAIIPTVMEIGFQALCEKVQSINTANGWVDDRTVGDGLALITSEVSEALEAFRDTGDATARWYTYTIEWQGQKIKNLTEDQVLAITGNTPEELNLTGKPEGVGPELADTIIRVIHEANQSKIPLTWDLFEKLAHNETRGYRHGGKHL